MTKEKEDGIQGIMIIVMLVLFVVLCVSCTIQDKRAEEQHKQELVARWNNGTHVECGGNFEYQQMVAGHHWMAYVYRCDKCGRVETFQYQMEFYDPDNPPED